MTTSRAPRALRWGWLVALAVVAGGCRPYHMYPGEFRSDGQVATVTQSAAVRMMTIDGRDTGVSKAFKLLPGEHALEVEVYHVERDVGSSRQPRGQFRSYVCTCVIEMAVAAGERHHIDAGEMADGQWAAWAIAPGSVRSSRTWSAVAERNPPHCTCPASGSGERGRSPRSRDGAPRSPMES